MQNSLEVRAERLRPSQIKACRAAADIAFLPLGALEWHGLHNPIGLDALKAHEVCCASARLLNGGVVFPPLIWGLPRDSFFIDTFCEEWTAKIAAAYGTTPAHLQGFAEHGGLDRQEQWLFYQRLLRMSLEHIASFGFRSIYICSGHNPLVHWVRPVAVAFSRATKMAGRIVTTDWGGEMDAAGLSGDHAGRWETSLMLAIDETAVDLEEMEHQPEYAGVGVGRDAPEAQRAQGEEWLSACASSIAAEARWLVQNYPALPPRHHHSR
jgi:creatinine amidohydrolase